MGEVDQKPFQDACFQKYSMDEAEIKVNNSNWHPFKQVFKDEKLQRATCAHNEECGRVRALVVQLARETDYKNGKLFEMEREQDERDWRFQACKEENERLKDEMELLKKEIEKQVKFLEESEHKSLLERRKVLANNERLEYDFKIQKKLCARLDAELKEQGYDLMIQKDLMINKEKMIFERERQMDKRIKMLQEQEDRYVQEETSIMRRKQKISGTPLCYTMVWSPRAFIAWERG